MFFILFPKHDTCVKNEGGFYYLTYYGKKPLSHFPNLCLFGQKHIVKKNWPEVWQMTKPSE